jgi:hypothetical protein
MPALNRPELKELICGILTLIRHRNGFATKTKLIKLLYLVDVESYRDRGETVTSLDWVFHLYGPWTGEYDQLLSEMHETNQIELREHNDGGDAIFVNPVHLVDLNKIPLPVSTYLAVRQMTERWADVPTRELLDYVYFETEPMMNAVRGERLDFRSVKPRQQVPFYHRVKSDASEKDIKRMRRELRERAKNATQLGQSFTAPRYDTTFFQAVNSINLEDE